MTDDQNTSHAAPADQELRIVVGVDGSECSDRALEFAAHEAARWGALLHVVGTYEIPSNSGWLVVPLGPFEEAAAANVAILRESGKKVSPDAPGDHQDEL